MLYTIVPLERIYRGNMEDVLERDKEKEAEFKNILLKHGHIVSRRVGEGYVIERVISTAMSDYLDDRYHPGKEFKEFE